MTERMAMPGDELAASEEYLPGPGTYEREGRVHSAIVGRAVFNDADRVVSVIGTGAARSLRPGDSVVGEVSNVTASLVTVQIAGVERGAGIEGLSDAGVIHISKVAAAYLDDARREFKVGDLVRARVLQAKPSVQLSTADRDLGVLRGLCGRCRRVLENRRGGLYCPDCDREERRKLAEDFGMFSPPHANKCD